MAMHVATSKFETMKFESKWAKLLVVCLICIGMATAIALLINFFKN